MVTPGAKRLAVAHLKDAHDVSERRACTVLNIDRSTVRYRPRRGDDADLRAAIRWIASDRRRFGYRRIHVMLRREGFEVNPCPTDDCAAIGERDQESSTHIRRRTASGASQGWQKAGSGHA